MLSFRSRFYSDTKKGKRSCNWEDENFFLCQLSRKWLEIHFFQYSNRWKIRLKRCKNGNWKYSNELQILLWELWNKFCVREKCKSSAGSFKWQESQKRNFSSLWNFCEISRNFEKLLIIFFSNKFHAKFKEVKFLCEKLRHSEEAISNHHQSQSLPFTFGFSEWNFLLFPLLIRWVFHTHLKHWKWCLKINNSYNWWLLESKS